MAVGRAKKKARAAASVAAALVLFEAQASPPRWTSAKIHACFYHKTRARRDKANLVGSLKAAIDGIQDAGIVVDDFVLAAPTVDDLIDKDSPRVEITIRAA
jgi:Holliday junction resolvase RusA-like endonuclease